MNGIMNGWSTNILKDLWLSRYWWDDTIKWEILFFVECLYNNGIGLGIRDDYSGNLM